MSVSHTASYHQTTYLHYSANNVGDNKHFFFPCKTKIYTQPLLHETTELFVKMRLLKLCFEILLN